MMFVGTFGLDMQIDAGGIAKRLEKVEKHFGGHIAYFLAVEIGFPHQPRTPAQVEGYAAQGIVHGQRKSITGQSSLVAQRPAKCLAQHKSRIFDGVMEVPAKRGSKNRRISF